MLSPRSAAVPRARARLAPRLSALLAAALAASTLLGVSLTTPATVAGMGPLPACRYDDILTAPRGYGDWAITLVDTILRVTKAYVPPDLVPVSDAGIGGSGKIRAVTITDLEAMTVAAKAAGYPIAVQSAYRSYTTQESVYQGYVAKYGEQQARLISARPGHSEHQLGLAIDFKSAGGGSPFEGDWGLTPAGTWMRKNAWEFGWVMSYPKGKKDRTCYQYESWHFRYVGRDVAAAIHASGLTPREYLWAHFTTAVVPTPSGQSPKPSAATAVPSLQPSPAASQSPSPSPSPAEPSPGASPSPSAGPTAGPSPSPTVAPASPAGAGVDPGSVAAAGLVFGLVALAGALALGRRRSRSGPGL